MPEVGRPNIYTEELGDKICNLISEGLSLVSICKQDGMPHFSTVFRWLDKSSNSFINKFCDKYARAREAQADYLAEEILEISDDGSRDYKEVEEKTGTRVVCDFDHIQRAKLRVDSRKWIASKLKPKKYGDRVEQILTGDPEKPIHHKIDFSKMTDEELNAWLLSRAKEIDARREPSSD